MVNFGIHLQEFRGDLFFFIFFGQFFFIHGSFSNLPCANGTRSIVGLLQRVRLLSGEDHPVLYPSHPQNLFALVVFVVAFFVDAYKQITCT